MTLSTLTTFTTGRAENAPVASDLNTVIDEVNELLVGTAGAVISVVDATEATLVLTEATSGTLYTLNRAGGIDVTLPALAAADVGTHYTFFCGTTVTDDYIITAAAGDLLYGTIAMVDTDTSNTTVTYSPDGTDDLIITLNGDTTGGLIGSWVEVIAITATGWFVRGFSRHSGNVATPFS